MARKRPVVVQQDFILYSCVTRIIKKKTSQKLVHFLWKQNLDTSREWQPASTYFLQQEYILFYICCTSDAGSATKAVSSPNLLHSRRSFSLVAFDINFYQLCINLHLVLYINSFSVISQIFSIILSFLLVLRFLIDLISKSFRETSCYDYVHLGRNIQEWAK